MSVYVTDKTPELLQFASQALDDRLPRLAKVANSAALALSLCGTLLQPCADSAAFLSAQPAARLLPRTAFALAAKDPPRSVANPSNKKSRLASGVWRLRNFTIPNMRR